MEINSIGYNHTHDHKFIIDRPNGLSSWLFLLIKTPAVFKQSGSETTTKSNSFILYSNDAPQYYKASGNIYIDDWIHFFADDIDIELFKTLEIPLNTVIELGDIDEISSVIRCTTYEFYSKGKFKTDITELYLKMLFLKLSDKLLSQKYSPNRSMSVYFERLQHLRNDILNSPCENWTVDNMSERLSMSRSSFQHTYKKIFGTNVMSDVIESKLQRVKFYLSTTNMTLSQIAEQSGYASEIYMMRQFKEKYGITPTQFRNQL